MSPRNIERRRGSRASIEAQLRIRPMGAKPAESFRETTTTNVSLAGVYFESKAGDYQMGDEVVASVSVPSSQQRAFPFTRLSGRGRVVRIERLAAPPEAKAADRVGIALEFGEDLIALTAIPARS